jgi:DNA helicase-2/ATP-dependent DNA helicase PcrA
VIGEASERFTKNLWTATRVAGKTEMLVTLRDDAAQANYVCDAVLAEREVGTALKSQAVLFRTSSHSGALEVELTRRNIPFVKFGGLKFLDAAHVKDMLAVLRLAENPRDRVAGFRVLQLLPGIGPSAAGAILQAMETAFDAQMGLSGYRPPAKAAADWPVFVDLFSALQHKGSTWPADLERVRLWYEPHLERLHEDATTRRADLLQLEQIAAGYPSRERFLTELTLDPPDSTSDQAGVPLRDEDYLILSTIHSAKGQEWKNVFVLNVVDGCIPSDLGAGERDEIEEERRLLYVAMTRAQATTCTLITPQRFFTHGQNAQGDRHVSAANEQSSRQVRVDIGARMRSMWK